MKLKTALITALIAGTSIAAISGGLVYKNHLKILAKAEARERKLEDVPQFDLSTLIQIKTIDEIHAKRLALINLIWGTNGLPIGHENISITATGPLTKFTVNQAHGINSNVELINKPTNTCLAIYHQGHANPEDVFQKDMLDALTEKGCDVLTLDMPIMGKNPRPTVNTKHGPLNLFSHDYLALVELPHHHLRLYMEPIRASLDYATSLKTYSKVVMLGISGGGWSTTLYAALDERIQVSVPVAGSLPLFLMTITPTELAADFEFVHPDLMSRISYPDLYVMATDGGRKQTQMLNRFDDCCFAGTASSVYAMTVAKASAKLGGDWNQYIDMESRHHHISKNMIQRIKALIN